MSTETEVKMKRVVVSWREEVFYATPMEVPEDWNEEQIEDAFWEMDLSGAKPVDTDYARVDQIYRTYD